MGKEYCPKDFTKAVILLEKFRITALEFWDSLEEFSLCNLRISNEM